MRLLLTTTAAVLLICATASAQQVQPTQKVILKNLNDSISYAYGISIAKSLDAVNMNLNYSLLSRGLTDTKGGKAVLDIDQLQSVMSQFKYMVLKNEGERIEKLAVKNSAEEKAYFDEHKKKPNIKTTASGLQYEVIGKGPQKESNPTLSDTVTFNYEGRFLDGTKFESTYEMGIPARLPMKNLLKGWQEGLMMMKPGDTIMLYMPSDLAFGKGGSEKIEPNKGLIFRIDLIKITRGKN